MRDLGVGSSGNGVKMAPARSSRLGEGRPLAAPEQEAASSVPRTIGEALRAHAALRPEQAAIVASELAPVSYRRLTEQIDEIRVTLRQVGLDASARIVVAIPDTAPAALAIVAVACSAVALPLDPKLTLPEIEARLILLRPSAVLLPRGSRTASSMSGILTTPLEALIGAAPSVTGVVLPFTDTVATRCDQFLAPE